MKIFKFLMIISIIALLFIGCEDRTTLNEPNYNYNNGDADFTSFVSLGNSLTAGYMNGCIYESGQTNSFGNLISKQIGATYAQPIYSNPGTGNRMELNSLEPLNISYNSNTGDFVNATHPAAFNNLGIPGAVTYDILNATNSDDCMSGQLGSPNPYFDIVLRGNGLTSFQQAKSLNPTFMTLLIGNNDILGYATSGGMTPFVPTEQFSGMYNQLVDSLATLDCDIAVGNLPNSLTAPFFTTIGPKIANALNNIPEVDVIRYQKHDDSIQEATIENLLNQDIHLTLTGSSYAELLGQPTGKYYTDNNLDIPSTVDTMQAFGLHPANPWPNALTIDIDEKETILNTINSYNSTISVAVSNQDKMFLVDINEFMNSIATSGINSSGLNFNSNYIVGGIFSLDGIHPSRRGYGIIANKFLERMDSYFGSNIEKVDVSEIPGIEIY